MQPEASSEISEAYRALAEGMLAHAAPFGIPVNYGVPSASSFAGNFYPLDVAGIGEVAPYRDLAASRNQHKEAEKERRKRINSHLDRLRNLLPCNSKTDKASLLAKVVQHVKELKKQTSEIAEFDLFPSESDEITVFCCESSGDGRSVLKASICCEDRSDLLPELIQTLKSLRLRTLRAEMATMGGRVRSVLSLVAGDEDEFSGIESVGFLEDALRTVVNKQDSGERGKRRRIFDRIME